MKRKFYFALMGAASMFFVNTTNAQIAKGSTLLGGSIGFNSSKSEQGNNEDKASYFNISPALGIAIKENFIVGGDLNFNSGTTDYSGGSKVTNTAYGVGVFARQYKNIGTSGFYVFGQARLGASITERKTDPRVPAGTIGKRNGVDVGLGIYPGISYAVSKKLHIETGLANLFYAGYQGSKDKPGTSKSSGFNAGVNLGSQTSWTVGIRFLLAK